MDRSKDIKIKKETDEEDNPMTTPTETEQRHHKGMYKKRTLGLF